MSAVPATIEGVRQELGPAVRIVGVIGSPVAHSLSPLLHNAAFVALGLEDRWRSFAFEVPEGEAAGALDAVRRARVTGLSVTMPHKAAVAALVDECSEVARRLDAVNCVVNRGGVLYGTNTDGEGFVASLRRGAGFDPAGRRCLVVGAGGAARAVVVALAGAGAAQVSVANRTLGRAEAAAALAGPAGSVVDLGAPAALSEAVTSADLVVNATPLGMAGTPEAGRAGAWLVEPSLLRPGQVAADLVYAPRPTAWLAQAASAGAAVLDGLGMLVHQAAAQLELWTGAEPPVEAMWQAAEAAREA
ncbi:MAG TPA: shikimate dehydrogenase [Acidimicrobiales bacterium]|nr:shikimate dehydrogenase [Acidimicrobiales bacterium]